MEKPAAAQIIALHASPTTRKSAFLNRFIQFHFIPILFKHKVTCDVGYISKRISLMCLADGELQFSLSGP